MSKDKKMDKIMDDNKEMTLEEAKAYRASLAKPIEEKLTESQIREQFRIFWAQNRTKYGEKKELESILWLNMKSSGFDSPEKFEEGIKHFGLKSN